MNNIKKYISSSSNNIAEVMKIIDHNGEGICFILENEKLIGVVTDGDLRRALIKGSKMHTNIKKIMNTEFISLPINTNDNKIRSTFSKKLRIIPLCDEDRKLIDLADSFRSHRIPILEPSLEGNEMKYVSDCLETNWISSQGNYVNKFENIFNNLHQGYHSLAVSNGTVALHLALIAMGVGKKDEVIVPNITFAASINSIIHSGATPVLCEIDEKSWCINVDEAEKLITKKTKAIMPVHLFGQVCDIEKIQALARKYNLLIIEDCAEAIGSSFMKIPVGTFGDASTFSFFGNKTISTGEGGMVLFKDTKFEKKARQLRDHGMSKVKKYWHDMVGFNYRLTNIQAAIGVAQMERFDEILKKKLDIAKFYSENLKHLERIRMFPLVQKKIVHSNWVFAVVFDESVNRDKIIKSMMTKGIDTRPVFYPLSNMPPYKKYRCSENLSNSMLISKFGLLLPSSVSIKLNEMDFVVDGLEKSLND